MHDTSSDSAWAGRPGAFGQLMSDSTFEKGPYKMRTMARLTEFSPELLRAWERRHDLLHPMRGPGGHRLYTEDDLAVLMQVRRLITEGRSIGEIARFGREALLAQAGKEPGAPGRAEEPAEIVVGDAAALPEGIHGLAETVVQAALQMDTARINAALDEAFAGTSAENVISGVILPAAQEIGDLWMSGRCSVASEHLASGLFVHRLRKLVEAAEPSRSEWRPALVACFPDEYHQLGALVGAYWLCRNGFRVSFLGAALPFDDLRSAWEVLQPSATLLSVTRPQVYDLHRLSFRRLLEDLPDGMLLYVGGQGAPKEDPGAQRMGARIFLPGQSFSDVIIDLVNDIREHGKRRMQPYRA